MTKVVLDTNVVVSGLLNKHGAEAAVLFAVADGKLGWVVSPAILIEYERVLRRRKFARAFSKEYVDAFLGIAAAADLVSPGFTLAVSPDEADNRFLECAEVGDADYLITGNSRHFPKRWKRTRIVNARAFLTLHPSPEHP